MIYLWLSLLALLNLIWLGLTIFGLPGNWLMLAGTALFAWWQWDNHIFSLWTLVAAAVLAAVAELLEFIAGLAGSTKMGGSRFGAVGAIIGGLVGAGGGTVIIPIPILGTILGACMGAAIGAWAMELASGKKMDLSVRSGVGAGIGRFMGTIIKAGIGAVIWLIITVASFV